MEVTMDINTKRTRTTISIVMLIWAVVCIAVTGLYVGNNHAEAATTELSRLTTCISANHQTARL